jgi:hypothetical protein
MIRDIEKMVMRKRSTSRKLAERTIHWLEDCLREKDGK